MRCLIYAKSEESSWLTEYLPGVNPYLLKIANKPLVEYSLDFAVLMNIKELRIVSDDSIKELQHHLGFGTKWGIEISYAFARSGDSIQNVYLKNYSFAKNDDLLIWNGFFFLQYDRNQIQKAIDFSSRFCCEKRRILYLPQGDKISELCHEDVKLSDAYKVLEIPDAITYYNISMAILNKYSKDYVLPGYSNDKETFLGLNLVYPRSSELHAPIMIGNNCRFQKDTLVGPNSIIGNNVIIDDGSSVTHSIVYDNTYVGKDLDIDHKIVYKGHLISAESSEHIHFADRVLLSQVELGIVTSFFNRMVQRALALLLFLLQALPWLLLFLPYRLIAGKKKAEYLMDHNLSVDSYTDSEVLTKSWWGRMLLNMSLDKFDQLYSAAFSGKLYLVGNRLLTNTVKHREMIMELPVYNPGVFSLAESQKDGNLEAEIFYELEYIDKISTLLNLQILFRALFRRPFHGLKSKPQKKDAGAKV